MSELTKEQKQEIDQIVRKYLPKLRDRLNFDTPSWGIIGGIYGGISVLAMDVALTGGVFTVAASIIGASLGLGGGIKAEIYEREKKHVWVNNSGQYFESNRTVSKTLYLMETKLYKNFKQAAENKIPYGNFKILADEIEVDVKKLSPAFKIVSGGKNGYGTDKFEFVLDYKRSEISKPKIKTLTDERALTALPALAMPQVSALMKLVK